MFWLLKLSLLVVAVLAVDYQYDDYDYDDREERGIKSRERERDVDDYDYYDDYNKEDDRKKSKHNDDKEDYYDDYYDDEYEDNGRRRISKPKRKSVKSYDFEDDQDYYDDYEEAERRRINRKRSKKNRVRNFRKYGRSGQLDGDDYSDYNDVDRYDDYGAGFDYSYGLGSRKRPSFPRFSRRSFGLKKPGPMFYAARTKEKKHPEKGHYQPKKPVTKYVPVVVKKKQKKKKSKIVSVSKGFYIPGGTQLYGKFHDLLSCQKACELSATCFQGDYNPWLKKCYGHGNITACTKMKTSEKITHFSKVPCMVLETPRSLVTIGARAYKGVQMKGIDNLQKCIKKCVNMGGGIAPENTAASVASTPQICFAVDYDFKSHKCYIHTNFAMCANFASAVTPENLVKAESNVNVLLCPLAMG